MNAESLINPLLFPKMFHLGSRLDYSNRWMRLAEALPWDRLEELYDQNLHRGGGRHSRDARLVCGLFAVKLAKNLSDEETLREFAENPYIQAFCGAEYFAVEPALSPRILYDRRRRLAPEFFNYFDSAVAANLSEIKEFKFKSVQSEPETGFVARAVAKVKELIFGLIG